MPNAAPFLASPWRRVIAGAIDLLLYFIVFALASAVVTSQASMFGVPLPAAVAPVIYVLYHLAFFWYLDDATPGLRAMNMRIVRASGGGALSFAQMLIRPAFRVLMLFAFGLSASFLAGPSLRVEALLLAPLLLELGMMFTLPSRQTLSDLVARTLVVNVPPPEPHRAPAGPMYSPSDAEFGLPPGGRK